MNSQRTRIPQTGTVTFSGNSSVASGNGSNDGSVKSLNRTSTMPTVNRLINPDSLEQQPTGMPKPKIHRVTKLPQTATWQPKLVPVPKFVSVQHESFSKAKATDHHATPVCYVHLER
jgi:hypothetical protein